MKLIIFEGLDRTGKDSHIAELSKGLRNYSIRHWSFPQGSTDSEKTAWQKNSFHREFSHYIFLTTNFPEHVLFWNRAHLGELVYGKIYRNSEPDGWVPQLERLYGVHENPSVYLIHLTADAEFLVTQDDGNSYSSQIDKKSEEIQAFRSAVENSLIQNKLILKINDNDQYRSFQQLSQEIRSFIGI